MDNAIIGVIYVAFVVFIIASVWKIFVKAGQPGWASIIPIYNTLIQLRIIARPWWWILLLLVPIVNIVILFMLSIELAKSFGKGSGFGVGLVFLPFIFYPILGFGSAQYVGPGGSGTAATAEPTTAW
jgi:hypothetical protein